MPHGDEHDADRKSAASGSGTAWTGDAPAISLSTTSLSSPSVTTSSVPLQIPGRVQRRPDSGRSVAVDLAQWLERTRGTEDDILEVRRTGGGPAATDDTATSADDASVTDEAVTGEAAADSRDGPTDSDATARPAPGRPGVRRPQPPRQPAKPLNAGAPAPVMPAPTEPRPAKPGPAKPGPAKPGPAKPGPAKPAQARVTPAGPLIPTSSIALPAIPQLPGPGSTAPPLGQWLGPRGHRRGSRVRAEPPRRLIDRAAWLLTVLQLTCVGLFACVIPFRATIGNTPGLDGLVFVLVVVSTAGLCARAALRERKRRTMQLSWLLLTAAHLAATLSHSRSEGQVSDPSLFGVQGWIVVSYFPMALAALWLLMRDGMPRWLPSMWGDAVVVGLGALAAGTFAASLLRPEGLTADSELSVAYLAPLADVVLLAVIVSVAALTGSRLGAAAWWVTAGMSLVAGSDLLHLLMAHADRYTPGGTVDLGWLVGYAAVGVGAQRFPWSPFRRDRRQRPRAGQHLGALPWAFSAISAAVLASSALGSQVPRYAAVLALGCLCAALLRVGLTLAELDGSPIPGAAVRTDELTGLANRRALSEALASDGAATTVDGGTPEHWSGWTDRIALLLVDLDSFKDINEALGHDIGDRVLAEVGARLRAALRSPQLIARLGGDEFAVVLPGAGRESATKVAESLCAVLAEPVEIDGHRLHVRASVGVATCLIPHEEPEDLLRQADVALNRAKAFGTSLEVFDPTRDLRSAHRLMRIDELRSALERGDLEVYLQPQVDLITGSVVGAEALARWRHPQDGVLLPDSFLPLAAQTGLMRPVAALVLDRALGACAQWWRRGYRIPVSVNLTPDDLRDAGMSQRISECLTQHGLPAQALRIEITEDVLLTDPAAAGQLLQSWRRAGIAVAVDDFGTGYSSLGYLRELPFDELKLDRSFVSDLHRRTTATIVRHTVAMAHGLGMRVVAEGVEDQATARTLSDVGCDIGQGLYFGAAMALPSFLEQLEQHRN